MHPVKKPSPVQQLIEAVQQTPRSVKPPPWLQALEKLLTQVHALLDIPSALRQLSDLEVALHAHDVRMIHEAAPTEWTHALALHQRILRQRHDLAQALHGDGYETLALEIEAIQAHAALGLFREAEELQEDAARLAKKLTADDFRHPTEAQIAMREALLQGADWSAEMLPPLTPVRDAVKRLQAMKAHDEARALQETQALIEGLEEWAKPHVRDWLRPSEWRAPHRPAVEDLIFTLSASTPESRAQHIRKQRAHALHANDIARATHLTEALIAMSDPKSEVHFLDRCQLLELRMQSGEDVEAALHQLADEVSAPPSAKRNVLYGTLSLLRQVAAKRGDAVEELRIALHIAHVIPYRKGDDDQGLDRAAEALDLATLFRRANRLGDARAQIARGLRFLPAQERLLRFDLHAEHAHIELAGGDAHEAKRALERASACAIEDNPYRQQVLEALRRSLSNAP